MKKLIGLFLSGVAVIALSGCSSDSSTGDSSTGGDNEISSVDVLDLQDGYQINGYNDAGQDVILEYCDNTYSYFTGPGAFSGTFAIGNTDDEINARINMFDDDGGSYRIDTEDGYLRVDEEYDILEQGDEIIVESIVEISC